MTYIKYYKPSMVEQISKDQVYKSSSAKEFSNYMGKDLRSLDLNSNLDIFSKETHLSADMENHQIVANCLKTQLGVMDSMSDGWRADPDSEPDSGWYTTSKYSYEELNERISIESPEEILASLEKIDLSRKLKAFELGLQGDTIQSIPSFVDLIKSHVEISQPVESFRSEILAYAVVLSLEDKYRHVINKRLYLEKCCVNEALRDVLD